MMNNLLILTKRNLKEIIRDPLSIIFCLGFPIVMLVFMQLIMSGMEFTPENFQIENFAIGICLFGFTFAMLFTATTIAGDKNTEFINRLMIAPIKKSTYLLSFVLAILPITICQTIIFFTTSLLFGFTFSLNLILAIIALIPSAIFYITLGILFGTLAKTEKHAGPLCSIIISVSMILGGVFMPTANMGVFTTIVNALPFIHTLEIATSVMAGNFLQSLIHLAWTLGYTLLVWGIIILLNKKKQ